MTTATREQTSKGGSVTIKEVADTFGGVDEVYMGEPIPRDRYLLEVIEAVKKYAKADDFPYVELRLAVLDGDYKGRRMTERLFLRTEKADGSPSQAMGQTKATLRMVFGGDVPTSITSISKYDSEKLATAIVESVKGATFESEVVIEKDKSEDGAWGDKNRLQPRRAK